MITDLFEGLAEWIIAAAILIAGWAGAVWIVGALLRGSK